MWQPNRARVSKIEKIPISPPQKDYKMQIESMLFTDNPRAARSRHMLGVAAAGLAVLALSVGGCSGGGAEGAKASGDAQQSSAGGNETPGHKATPGRLSEATQPTWQVSTDFENGGKKAWDFQPGFPVDAVFFAPDFENGGVLFLHGTDNTLHAYQAQDDAVGKELWHADGVENVDSCGAWAKGFACWQGFYNESGALQPWEKALEGKLPAADVPPLFLNVNDTSLIVALPDDFGTAAYSLNDSGKISASTYITTKDTSADFEPTRVDAGYSWAFHYEPDGTDSIAALNKMIAGSDKPDRQQLPVMLSRELSLGADYIQDGVISQGQMGGGQGKWAIQVIDSKSNIVANLQEPYRLSILTDEPDVQMVINALDYWKIVKLPQGKLAEVVIPLGSMDYGIFVKLDSGKIYLVNAEKDPVEVKTMPSYETDRAEGNGAFFYSSASGELISTSTGKAVFTVPGASPQADIMPAHGAIYYFQDGTLTKYVPAAFSE